MFSKNVLLIDPAAVAKKVEETLREQVLGNLRRRGIVVGLSGGIDSSVVAALAAQSLAKEKVLGLFMPERDSSGDSLVLGRMVAESIGIKTVLEEIAKSDPTAKAVQPEHFVDASFIQKLDQSGVIDRLYQKN